MSVTTHHGLLASLSHEEKMALIERSNGPAIFRAGVHLGAIALLAAAIAMQVPYWPLLIFPLGILLVFLFTLQHETTHETAFASLALNTNISRLCGFLLIVPPLWFRFFHFAHHRNTQDPEKDPELEGGKPETVWQYVCHVSGIPLWRAMLGVLFNNALGRTGQHYIPKSAAPRVQREARIMLTLYMVLIAISVVTQSSLLIWIWILPAIVGQPFLRMYLLAEHGRCPMVSNMLENTRTTFTNRIVRWIAWNMPYHSEHHTLPTVPFHKLPAFHAIARDHLRTTSRGYGAFQREFVGALEKGPSGKP